MKIWYDQKLRSVLVAVGITNILRKAKNFKYSSSTTIEQAERMETKVIVQMPLANEPLIASFFSPFLFCGEYFQSL